MFVSRRPSRVRPWLVLAAALAAAVLSGCSSQTSAPTTTLEPTPSTTLVDQVATKDPSPATTPATTSRVAPPTTTVTVPDERPAPSSAIELAPALSEAELAIRRTDIGPETLASWARHQQRLYRVLSANRSWADEVLSAVDPSVADAVAGNWQARLSLDALLDTSRLSDTLPAWRIEAPTPAEELLGYYRSAADETGVPWEILAAINLIETRMGRINGLSTAGALGPMQFLPSTWEGCCAGDPTNDRDAIVGAATYLVDRGAATDLDRALFGYNNSEHYVMAVRSYAAVMATDPAAYYGFHGWEVYFLSTEGLVRLPIGYEEPESVDAARWLAANPDALIDGGT